MGLQFGSIFRVGVGDVVGQTIRVVRESAMQQSTRREVCKQASNYDIMLLFPIATSSVQFVFFFWQVSFPVRSCSFVYELSFLCYRLSSV